MTELDRATCRPAYEPDARQTAQRRASAARCVATRALDPKDLAMLLDMLGLVGSGAGGDYSLPGDGSVT